MDPEGPFSTCQASLRSPWPDLLLYLKLGMHLTILRASSECMRLACLHPSASTEWTRRVHSVLVSLPFMLAFTQLQALTGPEGSSQCLSGLLAFTMTRSVTLRNHSTIFITQLQATHLYPDSCLRSPNCKH